ncbi:aldehyde dehydrogenase family protein, partial [Flavobacteriaceae bacterium]|nr:aldehyde dehydrogenase family protein [Flavobacteriaceae bacterium]
MNTSSIDFKIQDAFDALGIKDINLGTSTGANSFANGAHLDSFSPVDGKKIGTVVCTSAADYEAVMTAATAAFPVWRTMPAPQRGEIVRQFGNKLRDLKEPLGKLVSYEMGKSLQEGYG